MDAKEIMPKVLEKNVAYVPGGPFYPNGGNANHFRLNYSNMPEDRIVEGIKTLRRSIERRNGQISCALKETRRVTKACRLTKGL